MIGAWLAIRGVRRTYEHLNRRDLESFLAAWKPDAVFEFPGDISASGRFMGTAEIYTWFERFLSTFPASISRSCTWRWHGPGPSAPTTT